RLVGRGARVSPRPSGIALVDLLPPFGGQGFAILIRAGRGRVCGRGVFPQRRDLATRTVVVAVASGTAGRSPLAGEGRRPRLEVRDRPVHRRGCDGRRLRGAAHSTEPAPGREGRAPGARDIVRLSPRSVRPRGGRLGAPQVGARAKTHRSWRAAERTAVRGHGVPDGPRPRRGTRGHGPDGGGHGGRRRNPGD